METLWFCLVALLLAGYVVLDGFDIGAGVIHLVAAKTSEERRAVLASIGPVWDGNEVWLLAAGGTLYFAFPGLYASSFSGFYLALIVVLWLLILRGISIEFRNHVKSELWSSFWDVVFAGASLLLAVFYGAALGNVVRGVPIGADGYFFLPFWTDFLTGPQPGIIDWYTVLIGVTALVVLAMHGSLWVALKTEGALHNRAAAMASRLWWAVAALAVAISAASFQVQPLLARSFAARPWGVVFPLLAVAGLAGIRWKAANAKASFVSSAAMIIGLLCSAAIGLYPNLLPSNLDPTRSLTIRNVAAAPYGLETGLIWFVPAFALTIAYNVMVFRHFSGKVNLNEHGH